MSIKFEGKKYSDFVSGLAAADAPASDDYGVMNGSTNGLRKIANGKFITPVFKVANSLSSEEPYNDLNALPCGEICLYSANYTDVLNKPADETRNPFTIYTYGNNSINTQIFSSATKNVYMRTCWGSSNWGNWQKVSYTDGTDIIHTQLVDITSETYQDLNSYPTKTICYNLNGSGDTQALVSNKPSGEERLPFSVFTFGYSSFKTQIYTSSSNKVQYMRSCWNDTWGSWQKVSYTDGSDIVHKVYVDITSETYQDLNSYPNNTIAYSLVSTGDTQAKVANKPSGTERLPFSVFTFGGDGVRTQIYSSGGKKQYIRSSWGSSTWGSWTLLEPNLSEDVAANPLAAFNNIVCIGDSLTYGQVYTSGSTSRQAYKPYPAVLGKLCGCETESFAVGGYTASQIWSKYNKSFSAKTNPLAIIYLGTNGGLTDTLDTDAPESSSYSEWADTNTGCYAKIIARMQELGYKVLLIQIFAGGGDSGVTTTNSVIKKMATRFGCAVIDNFRNDEAKYHYWPSLQGSNTIHFNDLGYAWFASTLISRVARLDGDVLKYIIPD